MGSFISDIEQLKSFLLGANFGNYAIAQKIFAINALLELICLQPEKKRGTQLELSLDLYDIILQELISIKIILIQCYLDVLSGYAITIDGQKTILSTILFDNIAVSNFAPIADICGISTELISSLNTINTLIDILIPVK
jgi:hypothetical protein